MKIHQSSYPFVVALTGCSISDEQELFLAKRTDQVLLMLDGDGAGRKAIDELILRLTAGCG